MCRREAGGVAQGDAQIPNRLIEVALLPLRDREIVARLGMRWAQRNGAGEHDARAIDLFGPPQCGAKVILRVEEGRTNRDRTLELGDRFVSVPLRAEHEA